MPLTSKGFDARRFSDIRTEMFDEMATNLAIELDTSPDQILSIITNIFASSVTDIEELAQAVADNFNIDKAEGKYLDDLVALINLKRLDESFTSGVIHVKSTAISSVIAANSTFADTQGNEYTNLIPINVSNLDCTEIKIQPITNSGTFSVTIDGITYSVTYAGSTASSTIADGLYNEIVAGADPSYNIGYSLADELYIRKIDKSNSFEVTTNANVGINEVEVSGAVRAVEIGNLDPEIGTVDTAVSNITGLVGVTNYFRFATGRQKETDEELRARHGRSTQISGKATAPAMFSRLSNITGVSQVRVFQNKTFAQNSDGLPPKSFECIVEGGDEQEIADTIYDAMPLGVETYGTNSTIVQDFSGNNETVRWSRPSLVYMNVRVTYSLYDEESFPSDGNNSIKDAVVAAGEALSLDNDVIPQRFLGQIYNTVDGIGEMTVEIGTSVNPASTTPDDIPYTTDRISINARSKPDFDVIRVQVVQE